MAASRLDTAPCPVPSWLPDWHSQTIYASLFAQYNRIAFVRERVETPDGDFVISTDGPGLFPTRRPTAAR